VKGYPWIALPFNSAKREMVEMGIPCDAYPTVGVLNGTTGDVIDRDVLDRVNQKTYNEWMKLVDIGSGR